MHWLAEFQFITIFKDRILILLILKITIVSSKKDMTTNVTWLCVCMNLLFYF